ncbi:hypothetical protein DITRI_Ditri08aG0162100 [Diplodiscus trichospermus]
MAQAIFLKSLTDTDIKKRMAIPAKILPSLPDFNGSHADEAGSFHYMVQVEKPARPSRDLSPPSLSLHHEDDETSGTIHIEACKFQSGQEQLLESVAPIKHDVDISELDDIATDALVTFVDHVIAKPPTRIFGTNVSDEASSKAHFKCEHEERKMKVFGKSICMVEPRPELICSYCMTTEEREIKFFSLVEDGAMADGTSEAVGDVYYRSCTERLSLDLTLGLPTP